MGTDISDIVVSHDTSLKDQANQIFSIDTYNILYQLLSNVRQFDGMPLMDSHGNVTSHLYGIFYRTVNLIENKIKPVYVFDGKPSPLKNRTLSERQLMKEKAKVELEEAIERGEENLRQYYSRVNYITPQIVDDTKKLLDYMGIPYVDAPSEGEAQASYMTKKNVDGVISQDYDCLLFGAKKILRNFAIYGRRKVPRKNVYRTIYPEYILLDETLTVNQINHDQLIDIGILVGTDFNEGIKGIGAKKALVLIKKEGNIKNVLKRLGKEIENLDEIEDFFRNPPVIDVDFKFGQLDADGVERFLCDEHDFSRDRIRDHLETLKKNYQASTQSKLDSFD
ncbi:flap endonuclease-1 [Thermoplasma sp. Kam2015]|uniref:flap endonuclease-1 n=1 Tax=Thermoplasma sp. Kam2015 TaxID=2094122 RepID=UPI000D8E7D4F|nr:flap endonuclease-1 [Thermoplasma sp. Kam2015]PYB68088.1 flap endonuclease-1 [Thermoplasma sp. Kam2015]